MSLTVSPDLMEQAKNGKVDPDAFLDCIKESLPYAWQRVMSLIGELDSSGADYAMNGDVPPDDAAWGQLFRLFASDSMRDAIQARFGVRLAFQNCCKIAVFRREATEAFQRFTSPENQILNQTPELQNC